MTEIPIEEIDALLAELWKRHLPTLLERLDTLDQIAAAAANGLLAEALREEGQSIAHKLAGNLGMFGYKRAGEIASEMEHLLKAPCSEDLTRLSGLAFELRRMTGFRE